MNDNDAIIVLKFLARNELVDAVFIMEQDGELVIAENCNDLFFWACADMEEITPENLPVYGQAIKDCEEAWSTGAVYAGALFACRIREMRPQNACYVSYPKQIWPLLDAAGPEREVDFGNPYTRIEAEKRWEEKAPPYFKEKPIEKKIN